MSRRLSNIEWAMFQDEVNVDRLDLPPWGGVIAWRGMNVLVYRASESCGWLRNLVGVCEPGEIFLTDVSDLGDLNSRFPRFFDADSQSWLYQLPEQSVTVAVEQAAKAGALVSGGIVAIAETVGGAAGGLTKPLLENLTIPLVIAGVLGIVLLAKR